MIERTPLLMIAALAALAVSACGDRTTVPGAAGGSGLASEEPIDAVPLPLDDNPLSPPPVVADVTTAPTKAPATTEVAVVDPAVALVDPPTATADVATKPTRVVTAPREPSRPIERPAERPTPAPAPASAPDKEPEKPVLTF
ncbi:MAG: hypothetical protein JWR59_769 [Brevundimonas sp.]|nr:hypothetical protein [Brevundimonas sp.]